MTYTSAPITPLEQVCIQTLQKHEAMALIKAAKLDTGYFLKLCGDRPHYKGVTIIAYIQTA